MCGSVFPPSSRVVEGVKLWLIPLAGLLFLSSSLAGGGEVLAKGGGYRLVAAEAQDGRSPTVSLFWRGVEIGQNEDAFVLLKKCTDKKTRRNLLKQLVKIDIRQNGGSREYQRVYDQHTKDFGATFLNFMDPEVVAEYKSQRVDFFRRVSK